MQKIVNLVDFAKYCKNEYLLAKIGVDTAENERNFAENLQKIGNYPTGPPPWRGSREERGGPGVASVVRAPCGAAYLKCNSLELESIFMLFLFWDILNAKAYELLHFAYKCLWLLISNATTYELESIPSNTLQSKAGIDIH